MRAILDTHVLLWWFEADNKLPSSHRKVIKNASKEPLLVSDISLWEIATLCELGRIHLALPVREWLEQATAPPLVHRCSISPAVVAAVASLPATFHRDPADRIIVSTARVFGATLLTCDDRIIKAGIIPTLS